MLVTDDLGSILSDTATLTVLERPIVRQHPVSQSAAVGQTVVWSVVAAGKHTLSGTIGLHHRSMEGTLTDQPIRILNANEVLVRSIQFQPAGSLMQTDTYGGRNGHRKPERHLKLVESPEPDDDAEAV